MNIKPILASQARDYIATAAGPDLPEILAEVEQGQAEAWRIDGGKAYMVTRIESGTQGHELVVVCFEGRSLRQYAEHIIDKARAAGCGSIRYHTDRPGMGRMLERFGFEVAETVYRALI